MDEGLEALQGAWQAVRVEVGGADLPHEEGRRLWYVFEGDRVTLYEGSRVTGEGTVSVNIAAVPHEIDVAMTSGPEKGQKALGVYELSGGRLKVCIGFERPTSLGGPGQPPLVELEYVLTGV